MAALLRVVSLSHVRHVDDAFITYRYAEQIASGKGFVYNAGERVLGTTTPLYTLLLSGLASLGASTPAASVTLNVLLDLSTLVLLFLLGRRWHDEATGVLIAAAWGLAWIGVSSVGYGMEAQLFIALMVLALWLRETGHWKALGTVLAASILTRPEGVIVAALVGASLLSRRRALLRVIALAAVPLVLWAVYAELYFGSPIPQSVSAKISQTHSSLSEGIDFFFGRSLVLVALWVFHMLALLFALRRRRASEILLLVLPLALTAFYLVTRPVFLGAWYFPPVAVGLFCGASLGMYGVGIRLRWIPRRAVVPLALLAWVALASVAIPRSWRSAESFALAIDRVYRPLADYLRDESHPTHRVLASDIGYLGYYSGRPILDAAGLVTPQVVERASGIRGDGLPADVGIAVDLRPEFVVLPIKDGIYGRFVQSRFSDFYDPVARFQQEGKAELVLSEDPSEEYARRGHFVADFIVFRRVEGMQ